MDILSMAMVLAALKNYNGGSAVLEGTGSEYYTLAPTALTFRSTAPLNEFQEVQVNGQTVDPSNYTLEEGSTIVKLSIDYLKTLDVGKHEVAIVSESKTVKGDFTVKAPELNEHGFYYNQPYTASVAALGGRKVAFFIRYDGTLDTITIGSNTSICTYTIDGDTVTVVTENMGTLTATLSSDPTEIFCNTLQTTFKLGDESIAADEDYIYIYVEELGGYEVQCIDKTQAKYGAIKTGINGIDTVKLADFCFVDNTNLSDMFEIHDGVVVIGTNAFVGCNSLESICIPASVTHIGSGALSGCTSLANIKFDGTVSQWNAITFESIHWHTNVPATHVQCSDGRVAL